MEENALGSFIMILSDFIRPSVKPPKYSQLYKREKREADKVHKKCNWFRGKNGDAFDSLIMIPVTSNSELKKEIDQLDKNSRLIVKVMERPQKRQKLQIDVVLSAEGSDSSARIGIEEVNLQMMEESDLMDNNNYLAEQEETAELDDMEVEQIESRKLRRRGRRQRRGV